MMKQKEKVMRIVNGKSIPEILVGESEMKVCDKCKKPMSKENSFTLKSKKREICDSCAERIVKWLETEEKPGMMSGLFGGNK